MYTALGFAVASASRMPWEDFVRKRLLDPLDMRATVFTSTAALEALDRASPHRPGRSSKPEVMPRYPMETPDAAGSIHSSARDLAKWLRFHLHQGMAGKKRIVSARNLTETHTPQIVMRLRPIERELFPNTIQMSYGMGWVIHDYRGHCIVSHGGAIDGFRIHITLLPEEKIGLALLCNLNETFMNLPLSNSLIDLLLGLPVRDWNRLHGAAWQKILDAAAAEERARLAKRRPGTKPSCDLTAYAGEYEHPAYGNVRVILRGGELVWRWNTFEGELEHFEHDTFTLSAETLGKPPVQFTVSRAGKVESMKVGGKLNVEFRKVAARREKTIPAP
jgi:CubicO group peptidase (beta-lactamase class C family)